MTLSLLFAVSATAETRTWTGVVSTDWFDDLNWSPVGKPAAGDTVVIDTGGTVNISQPLGFSGTILWTRGNITSSSQGLALAANTVMDILPGNYKVLFCPLINEGLIRLRSGSVLYLDNSGGAARVVNYGTLESQSDDLFTHSGNGGGRVENYGRFVKSGGTGVTAVANTLSVLNTGTVEVQTGTFQIAAGTLSGNFIGAGVNHWYGNFNLVGTVNSSNVLVNANLTGTNVTLTGTWTWQSGSLGNGTDNSFSVAANTLLTLVPGNYKTLFCPLSNLGAVCLTGPSVFYLDNAGGVAQVINHGTLESTGDDLFIHSGSGGGSIQNHGVFVKSGGSGITSVAETLRLINTGTVEARTGTIRVAAGTLGGNFIGAGVNHWAGNFNLIGTVNSSNVLINANLTGTNITFTGTWTWQSGGWGNGVENSFSLAGNTLLTLVPGNYKTLFCPLSNSGTMRLTGPTVLYLDNGSGNARLVNLNLLDSAGNDLFIHSGSGGGTLENRATFTKSGGSGATTVASTLLFRNTGTVTVQTGELILQNGDLTGTFNGPGKTVLSGSHTLTGDLTTQNMEWQSGNFYVGGAHLHGPMTWVAGNLITAADGPGLTCAADGTLTLVPGNYKNLVGALTNSGIVRLTGNSALYLDNGGSHARFVNLNLLDSTSDDYFSHTGSGGGVLDNRGTFTKSGGIGVTTVTGSLLFLNTGTVTVQTNVLSLQNSVITSSFNGPGKTVLTGSHTFTGDLTAQNLELQSGNFYVGGARLHGAFTWVAGNLITAADSPGLNCAADCALTLVPGNYKNLIGALTNAGTIRLTGNAALYLNNGANHARLVNLNLLDSTSDDFFGHSGNGGGVLDNRATFTKSGGSGVTTVTSSLLFRNTGTVNVQTSVLNLQNSIITSNFNGPGKTVLTGNHTFTGDLTAQNMELQSGSFTADGARLHGGFTWIMGDLWCQTPNAGVNIAADGTLTLVPGNYKFLHGILTNLGTVRLTSDTALYLDNGGGNTRLVNQNVLDSAGNNTFSHSGNGGGVLDNRAHFTKSGGSGVTTVTSSLLYLNAGTVTVQTGELNLQNSVISATFNGPGKTVLTGGHTFTGDLTAQNMELQSGNFNGGGARLHGAFKWATGNLLTTAGGPGLTCAADCTFTLVPGNFKYLNGTLTNHGAILLTGNTALYLDNGSGHARLVNFGLVDSQGDDVFSHSGSGGGVLENQGQWRKSVGTGSTTFGNALWYIHGGALEAFSGTFQVSGDRFLQQTGGVLSFRLNSDTDYGRVNFSGVAPLGGGLAAQVAPGYSPAVGSEFTVLTCASTNGQFTAHNLAPGYTWTVATTSTYTRLKVLGISGAGTSATFTRIDQVASNVFDLYLLVEPNKPYHMEAKSALDPALDWDYLGPFSSPTSSYVYRHTAVGVPSPRLFFRAVSP